MTPPFAVYTTPHYERLSTKLYKRHRDFEDVELRAKRILTDDPHNYARRFHIKKLEGVPRGEG